MRATAFWLLLTLLYLISLLLVVFPEQIVSWHARMYRHNCPDAEALERLDQMYQVFGPLSKLLVEKPSTMQLGGLKSLRLSRGWSGSSGCWA